MTINRRGFLAGAVAVAAVVALPTKTYTHVHIMPPVAPVKKIPWPVMSDPNRRMFYYLYPRQWAKFEADGFDMSQCRLMGQIPITGGIYARR